MSFSPLTQLHGWISPKSNPFLHQKWQLLWDESSLLYIIKTDWSSILRMKHNSLFTFYVNLKSSPILTFPLWPSSSSQKSDFSPVMWLLTPTWRYHNSLRKSVWETPCMNTSIFSSYRAINKEISVASSSEMLTLSKLLDFSHSFFGL